MGLYVLGVDSLVNTLIGCLQVLVDGDQGPTMLRVPAHTMPAGEDGIRRVPTEGDRLSLQVLLGQVDAVRFVEG